MRDRILFLHEYTQTGEKLHNVTRRLRNTLYNELQSDLDRKGAWDTIYPDGPWKIILSDTDPEEQEAFITKGAEYYETLTDSSHSPSPTPDEVESSRRPRTQSPPAYSANRSKKI